MAYRGVSRPEDNLCSCCMGVLYYILSRSLGNKKRLRFRQSSSSWETTVISARARDDLIGFRRNRPVGDMPPVGFIKLPLFRPSGRRTYLYFSAILAVFVASLFGWSCTGLCSEVGVPAVGKCTGTNCLCC